MPVSREEIPVIDVNNLDIIGAFNVALLIHYFVSEYSQHPIVFDTHIPKIIDFDIQPYLDFDKIETISKIGQELKQKIELAEGFTENSEFAELLESNPLKDSLVLQLKPEIKKNLEQIEVLVFIKTKIDELIQAKNAI